MTGYMTKLKDEMGGRLGCGIEVVEDRDLGCSCKFEFARNYARVGRRRAGTQSLLARRCAEYAGLRLTPQAFAGRLLRSPSTATRGR